jgi:hypothetical protein
MDLETLFSLSNLLVMPFWIIMIFLPGWQWTRRIMRSLLVIIPPAVIYALLIIPNLGTVLPGVASPSLAGIAGLLGTPTIAFAGWMHYLAFDLFVGRWVYLNSRARGISGWLMAPIMFFTLMLGPVGLLLYLGIRAMARGNPDEVGVI